MTKWSRLLLLVTLIISLSACGFHLRGYSSLPESITPIRLFAPELDTTQMELLSEQLTRAGGRLQQDDTAEPAHLTVTIDVMPERIVADNAGSGTSIVRLERQLRYSLSRAGEKLVDNRTLVQSVDVELDNNYLLGTQSEKQSAGSQLDRALFYQLLIQLKRL